MANESTSQLYCGRSADGCRYRTASTRVQIHQDKRQGVPHLADGVLNGIGLVGPLVIPGVTSCLGYHQGELLGHTVS
jgi:hypothetical protein